MDDKDFILLIERLGVSCSFLIFFVWSTYKASTWLGEKIILPLHDRHIKFIDRLEVGLENVVKSQENTMEILNQILLKTRELHEIKRQKKETVNAE